MSDDHLDKETSVSVDLTETGVTAKAKSRFVAAIDRLGGNLAELINVPMERRISRDRAKIIGETQVIEAVVQYGVDRLKHDPEFAQHVAENHFGKIFRQKNNKDAVLMQAVEDMRHDPLTKSEAESGETELDSQFIDRFERYAEDASTEQLRQKWGRVLSAEIRKPGTFSAKVLRIVDEIEPGTALLFEQLCGWRLTNVLPKCLVGELSFGQVASLTSAGLLVEPGMGQIRSFRAVSGDKGEAAWIMYLGEYALAFSKDTIIPEVGLEFIGKDLPAIVRDEEKNPAMPVYVLTDAGSAVAEILPNQRLKALLGVVEKIKSYLPAANVAELELDQSRQRFVPRKTHIAN
jgi:Protein of unknown function (DUF2806)